VSASLRDLFDPPPAPPRVETPAARATDPSTSHAAAALVTATGKRHSQAERVLDALRRHPGSTSAELAKRMGVDRFMPARRLKELETGRRAMRGNVRRCTACGNPSETWWPL